MAFLEKTIDELNEGLPELRSFVLPGGGWVSRVPAPGAHRLPPCRAPRDDARSPGGRRPAGSRLPEPAVGSPLRPRTVGRACAAGARTPVGAGEGLTRVSAAGWCGAARAAGGRIRRLLRTRPVHLGGRDPADGRLLGRGGRAEVLPLPPREHAPRQDASVVHPDPAPVQARRPAAPRDPRGDRAQPARVRPLPQGLRARPRARASSSRRRTRGRFSCAARSRTRAERRSTRSAPRSTTCSGSGMQFGFGFEQEADRTSRSVFFADPNAIWPHAAFRIDVSDLSDGQRFSGGATGGRSTRSRCRGRSSRS